MMTEKKDDLEGQKEKLTDEQLIEESKKVTDNFIKYVEEFKEITGGDIEPLNLPFKRDSFNNRESREEGIIPPHIVNQL